MERWFCCIGWRYGLRNWARAVVWGEYFVQYESCYEKLVLQSVDCPSTPHILFTTPLNWYCCRKFSEVWLVYTQRRRRSQTGPKGLSHALFAGRLQPLRNLSVRVRWYMREVSASLTVEIRTLLGLWRWYQKRQPFNPERVGFGLLAPNLSLYWGKIVHALCLIRGPGITDTTQ